MTHNKNTAKSTQKRGDKDEQEEENSHRRMSTQTSSSRVDKSVKGTETAYKHEHEHTQIYYSNLEFNSLISFNVCSP